jgi:uncharacterized protein
MTVAITGASGLIGTALVDSLSRDSIDVVRLVRRDAAAPDEISWDPGRRWVDLDELQRREISAVVHLAGAGVGDHRWTDAYKAEIRNSRVWGTETIARAAAALPNRPPLISASAIGFYGDTGADIVDETAAPGSGFLAEVVVAWEAAAQDAVAAGIRVAHPRTGLVVAKGGGAFAPLVPIFKAGVGGKLGGGSQWWSFIALTDEVRALRFLIDHDIAGPVNLVAPQPITNKQAVTALGDVLHRPSLLPVPGFALRAVLGEFAQDVLASQGIRPAVLADAGFTWEHADIHDALRAELVPPAGRAD